MTVREFTEDRARESEEHHRARAATSTRAATSPAMLANPAALGLAGFALANLLLNVINAGWLPHSAIPAVLPLAFFGGGIAQLIAAAVEFRRGNTFGATAFGSYGVFWLALVGFLGVEVPKFPSPAAANHALAVFMLCWLIWTVLLWVATFRVSLVLNLLFLNLIAVFAFLTAGLGFGNTTLVHVGGYLGIVLSVIGFYGALETVINETCDRPVIPNRLLTPRHLR
jgi:uncharacterized protein